jgi:hypothetical protein
MPFSIDSDIFLILFILVSFTINAFSQSPLKERIPWNMDRFSRQY